ncbi:MAG: PilZ domain-containing protein [Sphingopyxis sp.]
MKIYPNSHYVGVDKRIAPRTDVYARVMITLPDGRTTMATIVNISADGALLRHDQLLNEAEMITFKMPVIGRIDGTCAWSVGGRSGVQFQNSIESSDYVPMLRAMGARLN